MLVYGCTSIGSFVIVLYSLVSLSNADDAPLLNLLSHAQLSPLVLDYVGTSVRALCRLSQTCTLADYACGRDALWRRLIARDFGSAYDSNTNVRNLIATLIHHAVEALEHARMPYKSWYARLYVEQQAATRCARAPVPSPMVDRLIDSHFGGRFPPDNYQPPPIVPGMIRDPDPC